ncbi:MAG: family 16 glycosylhydrolase [Ignavibacteriae bacterium]|nr:family 16 glycosylhydrolase [Ignavibacteriota bacterium]
MKQTVKILFLILLSQTLHFAKDYRGAEYRTIEAFLYGKFEANYKLQAKDGILASFFTYFTGTDSIPWTTGKWNEIDIEILGRYNNNIQFNTITPGQTNHVRSNFVNFDPTEDFHTYGFEWTPDYVAWFIDDQEVYRQSGSHISTLIYPQKIMMNIWNPIYKDWVGEFKPEVLPVFAHYDWVKYYSYTPGNGDSGSDNNFTFQWLDNFDNFDETRWSKATHTWDGNGCEFIVENAVITDGKLILCLTDDTNIGYVDKTPPTILEIRAIKNTIDLFFSEQINKQSAENKSSYTIVGVAIEKAELLEDQKTVRLSVSDLDTSKTYNVIALNIKDLAAVPNTMAGKLTSFSVSEELKFPLKINVGANEQIDFIADQEWFLDKEYGFTEGYESQFTASIGLTDLDQIYRTDMNGLVSYKVRVPNGSYKIKLMFAEKSFDTIGKRIFDVHVEGILLEDNLDILSHVPKNAAYDLVHDNIEVVDGILEFNFSAELDRPILSGIVIEKLSTSINQNNSNKNSSFFELKQNYPNPFNGETHIQFQLSRKQNVYVKIYDIIGNEIFSKQFLNLNSGEHQFLWSAINNNGDNVNSGIYIVNLITENSQFSKKMVYLK